MDIAVYKAISSADDLQRGRNRRNRYRDIKRLVNNVARRVECLLCCSTRNGHTIELRYGRDIEWEVYITSRCKTAVK